MTAATLWTAVKADYDSDGLITLTNIRDRSASTIDDTVGQAAAQAVINLWPVYAQETYDSADAAQVEVAEMGVIAMLWRRGGSAATIAKVEWDSVFASDGLVSKVKRTGARARSQPSSNSGVSQKSELTASGGQVRGWSDRDSLPPSYLPIRRTANED